MTCFPEGCFLNRFSAVLMVIVVLVQVMTLRVKTFLMLFKCLIIKTFYAFISFKCPKNSFGAHLAVLKNQKGWITSNTNVFSVLHLLLHWQLRERTATYSTFLISALSAGAESSLKCEGECWTFKFSVKVKQKGKKRCCRHQKLRNGVIKKEFNSKGLLGSSSLLLEKS